MGAIPSADVHYNRETKQKTNVVVWGKSHEPDSREERKCQVWCIYILYIFCRIAWARRNVFRNDTWRYEQGARGCQFGSIYCAIVRGIYHISGKSHDVNSIGRVANTICPRIFHHGTLWILVITIIIKLNGECYECEGSNSSKCQEKCSDFTFCWVFWNTVSIELVRSHRVHVYIFYWSTHSLQRSVN